MEIAFAAQVPVADGRCVGGRFGWRAHRLVDEGSDVAIGEEIEVKRAGGGGLGLLDGHAPHFLENADAGAEALLGMAATRQDGEDQPFGVWPDVPCPGSETFGAVQKGALKFLESRRFFC